jgi:DNA-formamidopyrimidine glycosylase
MPELPEVETVRRGLEHHVVGRTIETVQVLHPRAVRRQLAGPAEFESALAGRSLDSARRRGKYLWLSVGEDALLAHLGMSGQLLVGEPERPLSPHVRIWFTFSGGGPDLRFTDQRTFGHMCVVRDGAELPAPIAHIAPDPFEAAFDPAALARRLRGRRTGVKRALLDQSLVSGVGNIYADEALWRGAALGPAHRDAERPGGQPPARCRPRGARRGPGRRRDLVRRHVRRRQRGERLLRAVARGVRPGRLPVPAVRHAGPARSLHEPVRLQLPALSAPPPASSLVAPAPFVTPRYPVTSKPGCYGR